MSFPRVRLTVVVNTDRRSPPDSSRSEPVLATGVNTIGRCTRGGVSLQTFRLPAGPDFTPVSVHFRHEPLTDAKDYTRYFGCSVRFTEPSNGFRFQRSVLARPLAADTAVHEVVRDYLNTMAVPADVRTAEAVLT